MVSNKLPMNDCHWLSVPQDEDNNADLPALVIVPAPIYTDLNI